MKMGLSVKEFEANRDVAHCVVLVAAGKRAKGRPCPHCFCGGQLRRNRSDTGYTMGCCWCKRRLTASDEEIATII